MTYQDSFNTFDSTSGSGLGTYTLNTGGSVTIPAFDPSLGTLTKVTVGDSIVTGSEENWEVTNNGATTASLIEFAYVATPTETQVFLPFSMTIGVSAGGFASLDAGDSIPGVPISSVPGRATTVSTEPTILNSFLGTGNLTETFSMVNELFITNIQGIAESDLSISGSTTNTFTRTVTYEFTPVPEPGSAALFAAAVVLLFRRRVLR